MSGLGAVQKTDGTYLSIAGGYIWDRKMVDKEDPNYATQIFIRADKTEGKREGGQYGDFTGKLIGVEFKVHDEFGQSVNVTVEAGDEKFIISVSTNNRYSQDFMKALLKMDLDKQFHMKPYDFVDKDGKRAQGIVFRQDGEKIVLRNESKDMPSKDSDWFKTATKKDKRRFFEDLTEWFVAEVEEKVCPHFKNKPVAKQKPKAGLGSAIEEISEKTEEKEKDVPKKVTPLKMKQALKAYITENYEGKELPKLSREELEVWYNLSQIMEELPWPKAAPDAEVKKSDLDDALESLIPDNN